MEKMLSAIPASDLVVQWDYWTELLDVIGARDRYLIDDVAATPVNAQNFRHACRFL